MLLRERFAYSVMPCCFSDSQNKKLFFPSLPDYRTSLPWRQVLITEPEMDWFFSLLPRFIFSIPFTDLDLLFQKFTGEREKCASKGHGELKQSFNIDNHCTGLSAFVNFKVESSQTLIIFVLTSRQHTKWIRQALSLFPGSGNRGVEILVLTCPISHS